MKRRIAATACDETTQDEESANGSAGVVRAKNALKAAFKAGFYDHLWHEKGLRGKASHEIKHLQRDNLFFRGWGTGGGGLRLDRLIVLYKSTGLLRGKSQSRILLIPTPQTLMPQGLQVFEFL